MLGISHHVLLAVNTISFYLQNLHRYFLTCPHSSCSSLYMLVAFWFERKLAKIRLAWSLVLLANIVLLRNTRFPEINAPKSWVAMGLLS